MRSQNRVATRQRFNWFFLALAVMGIILALATLFFPNGIPGASFDNQGAEPQPVILVTVTPTTTPTPTASPVPALPSDTPER